MKIFTIHFGGKIPPIFGVDTHVVGELTNYGIEGPV